MSIQYIFGSSGSGKSHYLYQNLIKESMENPEINYYVIVPEQFTMSVQQQILNIHPRHGIMNVDILSFQRLAYRIFAETGTSKKEVLDDTGKTLVLRKVIENHKSKLQYFARNIGKVGFVEEVKSVISEFLQYSVTSEDIEKIEEQIENNPILKYKIQDIKVLFDGFQEYIKDRFIASEEILEVLCNVIENAAMMKDSVVILDGFTGFTPIQYRLIGILMNLCSCLKVAITVDSSEKANVQDGMENLFYLSKSTVAHLNQLADEHRIEVLPNVYMDDAVPYRLRNSEPLAFLEKNLFRDTANIYEKDCFESILFYEAINPQKEIDYVVGKIKELILKKGYRYSDIAVVTADIENYGYLAENIMEQNEIPCFVDYKRNLMNNLIVEAIRAAHEIIRNDFSYESMFRFLKTGVTDLTDKEVDALENYVLALGIRGFSKWKARWIRTYKSRYMNEVEIAEIEAIRQRVVAVFENFVENTKKAKTIREYCKATYEFMQILKLSDKAKQYAEWFESKQDVSEAGEYRQCYRKIIELLDQMVSLLGDEEVSFKEYLEIMDAGFEEIKVGLIPQKKDSVIIGDLERTRLENVKVLFCVGINDGNVPKSNSKSGVLSPVDREQIAKCQITLSPDERETAFIQRFYLYQMFTKASEQIILSYSRLGMDGKAIRMSYLIGTIRKMFPKAKTYSKEMEANVLRTVKIPKALVTWKEYCNENIAKEYAEILYGEEMAGSASRIEKFYQCAFAQFVSYGLKLEERQIYNIDSADIGTMFHDSLERISEKLLEGNLGFTDVSEQDRKRLVEEAVLEVTTDYKNSVLFKSERSRYFVRKLISMVDMTVWAVGEQLKHGKFVPQFFEKPFHTKDHIVGRIDRIDTYEDEENIYIKIVDYKTGNSEFDLNEAYHGMKLQLLTYMQAAVLLEEKLHPEKKAIVAGSMYYNIKMPFAEDLEDEEKIKQSLLESLTMNGIVNKSKSAIEALENEKQGKSIAIPVSFEKDGNLKENSALFSQEQMDILTKHSTKLIQDARKRMREGDVAVEPYRMEKRKGCDYCPYRALCGFDSKLPGYNFRNLKTYEDEEIWEKLGDEHGNELDK